MVDGETEADGEPEAEAEGDGCPEAVLFEAEGGAPVLVLGALVLVFGAEVVTLGADVVAFGAEVAAGLVAVAAGALVADGAGGATRGCCPEPNRNPTTVPAPGSYDATPLELYVQPPPRLAWKKAQ